MNTTEWLQEQVEDLEADIQLLSESIKRSESEISIWTKNKEDRQKDFDDYVKIQQQLSLIIDQMLLEENLYVVVKEEK